MTPDHLGGHLGKTHVDAGVLTYFYELGCRSVLDVGCGPGGQVRAAKDVGYTQVAGIDGDPMLVNKHWHAEPEFVLYDYEAGPLIPTLKPDLVWSCEFVEHVKPQYTDNFMKTFNAAQKYVVFTHATPTKKKSKHKGGANHWHFNEQESDYWVKKMNEYDWFLNDELTAKAKQMSTMKRKFFKQTGMVFTRG